jgi:hypothetical protein
MGDLATIGRRAAVVKLGVAQKSRFFDLAHSTPRRELAPFLKTEAVEHLGVKPNHLAGNLTHECVL